LLGLRPVKQRPLRLPDPGGEAINPFIFALGNGISMKAALSYLPEVETDLWRLTRGLRGALKLLEGAY
jgi:hypothetical protein